MKINNFNFKNRVVFMDEFNSIIEYLVLSSTLNKYRVNVFRLFLRILKEAKQIICVDADISDVCFTLLKHLNLDYTYYQNEYQHAKGVKARELDDRKMLIDKLSQPL